MSPITTPLSNPDCCFATTLLPARSSSNPSERVTVNAQCQREPGHNGKHEILRHLVGGAWVVIPTRWSTTTAQAAVSRA
jgi:hypothetical protein